MIRPTPPPWTIHADPHRANFWTLTYKNPLGQDRWLMVIQHNGEQTLSDQWENTVLVSKAPELRASLARLIPFVAKAYHDGAFAKCVLPHAASQALAEAIALLESIDKAGT